MRQGATLTAIAARTLGDGNRWPEVHALNRDRITDLNVVPPPSTDVTTPPQPASATTATPIFAAAADWVAPMISGSG